MLTVDPIIRISFDKAFFKTFLTACPTGEQTLMINYLPDTENVGFFLTDQPIDLTFY